MLPSIFGIPIKTNLERIIRGLLYVYIFSLPFKDLLFIERNGFIVLLVLLLGWCLVHKRHFFSKTPIDLPLLAFIGWVGFSVPFAYDPLYSFKEFAKLLQGALLFYTVIHFFRDATCQRRLVGMLIVSLAIVSVYGILQFETGPWKGAGHPESRAYYLIESFTPGEVWLTTYLVMLIPLGLTVGVFANKYWQRYAAWGTVCLGVTCQILTFSRAGLVALIVEGVVFSQFVASKKSKIILGIFVLAIGISVGVGGLLYSIAPELVDFVPGQAKFTARNLEARIQVWNFALEKIFEHPLVGIGFGKDNFQRVTGAEYLKRAKEENLFFTGGTHNTFVDYAVGSGIPALVSFVWVLGMLVYRAINASKGRKDSIQLVASAALLTFIAGVCVRLFFDHMLVGTMATQFWILVALGLLPLVKNDSEPKCS